MTDTFNDGVEAVLVMLRAEAERLQQNWNHHNEAPPKQQRTNRWREADWGWRNATRNAREWVEKAEALKR